jgi:hypothetical protein
MRTGVDAQVRGGPLAAGREAKSGRRLRRSPSHRDVRGHAQPRHADRGSTYVSHR